MPRHDTREPFATMHHTNPTIMSPRVMPGLLAASARCGFSLPDVLNSAGIRVQGDASHDGLLHGFAAFASALLYAAYQFVLLAVNVAQVIVSEHHVAPDAPSDKFTGMSKFTRRKLRPRFSSQ